MIKLTSDKIKVWKNKKEDGGCNYTYSISTKKQDGTYDYMSKKIKFMKDKEPDDTCYIKINNSFQSFFQIEDKKVDYLMVTDYELLEYTNKDVQKENESKVEIELTDDDLPF